MLGILPVAFSALRRYTNCIYEYLCRRKNGHGAALQQ